MWDPESHYQDDSTPRDNQDHAATTSSSVRGGNGQTVMDEKHIVTMNGVMGSNAASLGGDVHQAQFNPSGVRVKVCRVYLPFRFGYMNSIVKNCGA